MKPFMYGLLALILAVPFATPAKAQVVIAVGHHHHHHRYYRHHHHHYYHHY